jgi:hypothetical protein
MGVTQAHAFQLNLKEARSQLPSVQTTLKLLFKISGTADKSMRPTNNKQVSKS